MPVHLAPNLRAYAPPPYRVAVVHGGPGGAGEMAEVAVELSAKRGVLEPLQTGLTVAAQVDELAKALRDRGASPLTLIGHSWGAWLSLLTAAAHPLLVAKLILVSSGVFEERFVATMHANRLARLTPAERADFEAAIATLEAGGSRDDAAFARLATLSAKTDSFDPLPAPAIPSGADVDAETQARIYSSVWPDAAEMRRNGRLRIAVQPVACPVVAIHGDSDPSPAEGVREPLAAWLPGARFRLLERCGHTPWRERHARAAFFAMLENELESDSPPIVS